MKLILQLLLLRALLSARVNGEGQVRDYHGSDEVTLGKSIDDIRSVEKSPASIMNNAPSAVNTSIVGVPVSTAKSELSGIQAQLSQRLPSDISILAPDQFLAVSPNVTKSNDTMPSTKLPSLDSNIYFSVTVDDAIPAVRRMDDDNVALQELVSYNGPVIDSTALLVDPSSNASMWNINLSFATSTPIPTFPALLLSASPMITTHFFKWPSGGNSNIHAKSPPQDINDSESQRSIPNLNILSSDTTFREAGLANLEIQPKSESKLQILVHPKTKLSSAYNSEFDFSSVDRQKRQLNGLGRYPEAENMLRTQVGKIHGNNDKNTVRDVHGGIAVDEDFQSSNNLCSQQVMNNDQPTYNMLSNSKWFKVSEKPDHYLNEVTERKWQNNDESEECFIIKSDGRMRTNEMPLSESRERDACGGNEHLHVEDVCCSSSVADGDLEHHITQEPHSPRNWRISQECLSKRHDVVPDNISKRFVTKIPESVVGVNSDMHLEQNDIECECGDNEPLNDFAQREDTCKMSSDFDVEPQNQDERGPCHMRNWRNSPNSGKQYLIGESESKDIQNKLSGGYEYDDAEVSTLEHFQKDQYEDNEHFHAFRGPDGSYCTPSDFDDESEDVSNVPSNATKFKTDPRIHKNYNQTARISKRNFPNTKFGSIINNDALPTGIPLEADDEIDECEDNQLYEDVTHDQDESTAFDRDFENHFNDATCQERVWRTVTQNLNDVLGTESQEYLQSDISNIDKRFCDNDGHFIVIPYIEDGVIEEYKPNSRVFDTDSVCAFAPPAGNQDESVTGINLWEDWTEGD